MNILFVCSARKWGGNEKWSSMAMAELKKQGHTVHIMLRNPFLSPRFGKDIPWHFAPFITPFDPLSFLLGALLLRRFRPDAVISTKKAEYFTFGVLCRLRKIRHILRLGIVRDIDSSWKKLVYTKLNDGIIVNASRTKKNFLKYDFVDQEKIRLIYNGIPESGQPAEERPSSKEDSLRLISVGTLTPRKGFHILIEALTLVPEEIRQRLSLTIVGNGLMKKELDSLIREKELTDRVHLAGYHSDPSVLLKESDMFVLASENEGISNALLEAMILGLPVLTTPSGGTAEFMEDNANGYLVDRDAEAIAQRLTELVKQKEKTAAVGLAGRETVKTFFSLERMGKEVESFLEGP